jgi:hypothetical protein
MLVLVQFSKAITVTRKRVEAQPSAGTAADQYCLIARQMQMGGAPFGLVWLYMPL